MDKSPKSKNNKYHSNGTDALNWRYKRDDKLFTATHLSLRVFYYADDEVLYIRHAPTFRKWIRKEKWKTLPTVTEVERIMIEEAL